MKFSREGGYVMWLVFVVIAALSWGAYIPVIRIGQVALGSPFRAFLFISLAYTIMGIVVSGGVLSLTNQPGSYTARGMSISTLAGVLGAGGALGVVLALYNGGTPTTVTPLIFSFAPIVGVVVGMMINPPKMAINPLFFVGILVVAAGTAMVLAFQPH
jgi:hypothetical protein